MNPNKIPIQNRRSRIQKSSSPRGNSRSNSPPHRRTRSKSPQRQNLKKRSRSRSLQRVATKRRSPSRERSRSPRRNRSRSPRRSKRSRSPRRRHSRSPVSARTSRNMDPYQKEIFRENKNEVSSSVKKKGTFRKDDKEKYTNLEHDNNYSKKIGGEKKVDVIEKEVPNYEVSGKLAAELNTYKGVELKYSEPAEARIPKKKFRLYIFKDNEQIDLLHVYRQSAYLIGRDRLVCDIPIDHPSCSKQHAVLQYRQVEREGQKVIKPYIIDLGSSNGTVVNKEKIPNERYVELLFGDVIKFGFSSREYVFMNEEVVN